MRPTPTPLPAPTPTPPELVVQAVEGSGLVELRADPPAVAAPLGVKVDGVLRAVSATGTADGPLRVWVPAGTHDVCLGAVPEGAEPSPWEVGDRAAVTSTVSDLEDDPGFAELTDPACGQVTGTVDTPGQLLPGHRIVAHYGTGVTAGLGVLGEGSPDAALERVVDAAGGYDSFDLPVIPAFEFIVTVATADPGDDDSHSLQRSPDEVLPYLERIRSVGGVLVLDLQPGRIPFIDQVRAYEDLLREPDVHLALDPEWSMPGDQVPGEVIGSTDAEAVNEVLDHVDALVRRHGLPQKLVIVHQFLSGMVTARADIVDPETVAVMFHIDGQGPVAAKLGTYRELAVEPPYFNGFKVFFDEDTRVMTPAEVMAIEPRPVYVSYQ